MFKKIASKAFDKAAALYDASHHQDTIRRLRAELEVERLKAANLLAERDEASESYRRIKKELAVLREASTVAEKRHLNETNKLSRELEATQQAFVATCEAFAVALHGPGARPEYFGKTILASWPAVTAHQIQDLRQTLDAMKLATAAFMAWCDKEMKRSQDDNEVVIDAGKAPNSLHHVVIRLGDLKRLRSAFEKARRW